MKRHQCVVLICMLLHAVLSGAQTPGQVSAHVHCLADTTQQYAVYLPSGYVDTMVWPILFVFDPAARAELAARVFQEAAETLGYLVMVSENARNGPWEPILVAADAMFLEAQTRYAIDTNRIYTTGFSGGSRAAMLLALYDSRIQGVIGCGAGMPVAIDLPKPLSDDHFTYVGCVGTQDMNYQEQLELAGTLNHAGIENLLLIFRGPHQWPPKEILLEAMLYLGVQAMDDQPESRSLAESAFQAGLRRARRFLDEGYFVLSADILTGISGCYIEMTDVGQALELSDSIRSSREYEKQVKHIGKIKSREQALQEEFSNALLEVTQLGLPTVTTDAMKGTDWWIQELQQLRRSAERSGPLEADMYLRVYRSCLLTFIVGTENFAIANPETAVNFNKVWADADPESVWAQYQMAKLLVQTGDHKQAMNYLERAVEAGPKLIGQSQLDQDFAILTRYPRFQTLRKSLATDGQHEAMTED